MYTGLENLLIASLTTFTMPACEQLLHRYKFRQSYTEIWTTQRAEYDEAFPEHIYGSVSLIHNILSRW